MKINVILSIMLILISQIVNAQTGLEKINLSSWAYINLPPSMEIQSGIYKQKMDEAKKEFSVNAERVIFQQKGLNKGENKETYARVIIRTDNNNEVLPNLNTKKNSSIDLQLLNQSLKADVYQLADNSTYPSKIISWTSVKIVTVNGQKCLNYSYIRKMGSNPETYSEFYLFWKGKKQHSFNIEYRIKDSSIWKNELTNCIKSLYFK